MFSIEYVCQKPQNLSGTAEVMLMQRDRNLTIDGKASSTCLCLMETSRSVFFVIRKWENNLQQHFNTKHRAKHADFSHQGKQRKIQGLNGRLCSQQNMFSKLQQQMKCALTRNQFVTMSACQETLMQTEWGSKTSDKMWEEWGAPGCDVTQEDDGERHLQCSWKAWK